MAAILKIGPILNEIESYIKYSHTSFLANVGSLFSTISYKI